MCMLNLLHIIESHCNFPLQRNSAEQKVEHWERRRGEKIVICKVCPLWHWSRPLDNTHELSSDQLTSTCIVHVCCNLFIHASWFLQGVMLSVYSEVKCIAATVTIHVTYIYIYMYKGHTCM